MDELEATIEEASASKESLVKGRVYSEKVIPCMQSLRNVADEAESLVASSYWPYPTYGELLFST